MSYDKTQGIFILIHRPCIQMFSICIPNRMIYKSSLMMIVAHDFYVRAGRIFHVMFSFFSDILGSKCIHLSLYFK